MTATEAFINGFISDPEQRARYNVALLAELNSAATTVSPRDFAEYHLDVQDRKKFLIFLEEQEAPARPFPKDTGLVHTKLRKLRFEFESGVAVLAPPECIDETVKLKQVSNGDTKLEIRDRLTKVQGKR